MVKWILPSLTKQQQRQKELLSENLELHPAIAQILLQRGVCTLDDARDFFQPQLDDLHNPFLMRDMDRAVDRLNEALRNRERILIYGDYDVDGTTAVALVYQFLKRYHDDILYYLPSRDDEGSGISTQGIDFAADKGCTLVIALDCGIKAADRVEYAKEKGIDFIICDHHTADDEIPNAVAVLDPKREDCEYPYKELCGCGVGFKLMQAFAMSNQLNRDELFTLLDLVVVAIAGDIVPVTGENRVLAYYGLKRLNANPSVGLRSIIRITGLFGHEIQLADIIFKIGPRINASGRVENATESVDLLVERDNAAAWRRCKLLDEQNEKRKELDQSITAQALDMLAAAPVNDKEGIVLYNPEWHKGVIAIVASRLSEQFYKPTIIFTQSNGLVCGSARSVSGFDVYAAVESCRDLLESFGGHTFAVGLSMRPEVFPDFKRRFNSFVAHNMQPEQRSPQVVVDAVLRLADVTPKFYRQMKMFCPFGPDNEMPIFVSKSVRDAGTSRLVGRNREHIKLDLIDASTSEPVSAIAFRQAQLFDAIKAGAAVNICYTIEDNKFAPLQLQVKHITLAR